MRNYANTDTVTRTWISIQKENGSTLELGPGESIDLDTCTMLQAIAGPENAGEWKVASVPADFDDPHLRPIAAERKSRKASESVQEQSVNA